MIPVPGPHVSPGGYQGPRGRRRRQLAEAVELMAIRVAYEQEIGHGHAKQNAEFLERLRQRLTG